MIAAQDSYINDTAKNLFLANEDEQIRKLALDAEEHQNFINSLQNKIDQQASEIEKLKKQLNDNGINIG